MFGARFWLVLLAVLTSMMAIAQISKVICIDPGHPSEVGSGTKGKKLTELHAAWVMALKVKERLEKQGLKVVLTKSTEKQFVANKDRAAIANKSGAALMLRLHCDAASGSGISTYYPDTRGTVNGVSGPSEAVIDASRAAGVAFHRELIRNLNGKLKDRGLLTDRQTAIGGKQLALTGSIFSKVPVLLVEMCVLTNPADEAFLSSSEGQDQLADALAAGVMKAIGSKQ